MKNYLKIEGEDEEISEMGYYLRKLPPIGGWKRAIEVEEDYAFRTNNSNVLVFERSLENKPRVLLFFRLNSTTCGIFSVNAQGNLTEEEHNEVVDSFDREMLQGCRLFNLTFEYVDSPYR